MISIIIPTYNERENIESLIKRIFTISNKNRLNIEVVVVDDNSRDGTAEVVMLLSKKYKIKLLERPKKMGLTSAVIDGLKLAKGNIIGVMDADFSHPPEKIPYLVKALNENDIAIGSRFVKGGKLVKRSKFRHLVTKIAILLAKLVLGLNVKDPISGYFFLKRDVIEKTKIKSKGFKILLNILAKNKNKKIIEIPITHVERKKGRSKFGFLEVINYIRAVLSLKTNN